jgi:hypothetical protein
MIMKQPVLDRFLEPMLLTPKLAEQMIRFRAPADIQRRIDELAGKCQEGTLTEQERVEYESYVEDADVIALLQAKAQAFLADRKR